MNQIFGNSNNQNNQNNQRNAGNQNNINNRNQMNQNWNNMNNQGNGYWNGQGYENPNQSSSYEMQNQSGYNSYQDYNQGYNQYNGYQNYNQNSSYGNGYQNNVQYNGQQVKEKKQKKARKQSYSSYNMDANYKKTDIVKIIKVFAIMLIIIGIGMIAKSVYALSTNTSKQKDNVEVLTDKMGKEVTITVNTNYPIKQFSYKWNSGEESTVQGDGTVSISKTIDIPNGNNVLKITVTDYYGNKTDYMKQYIYESTDTEKPTIEIAKVGNKLKITATDNNKMKYLTYAWNDGEEQRIDAANDGDKEISTEIDVDKGENKLYVTAVDGEDNRQTRTETIKAALKPTFTIETEGNNVIIDAKDEVGVKKISITIDGQEYSQEVDDSTIAAGKATEIKGSMPMQSGNHTIKVVVTNSSGVEAEKEMSVSI